MPDFDRLIEHAFPLKQASLDSVHEKNVRHGHISTLHIWPARRPLAACRAALIATLLPDPGTPEKRQELCEKIGGKIVKKIERKKMPNGQIVEREKEVTEGGILHWGRETENKELLDWFRQEIRKAYGGRAPKVLDPFAGGGAIPLEAMRLGCEATAIDINPVAWFILKCTLEYPQKFAGKTYPLPEFILENEEFMNAFYKAHPHLVGRTKPTKKQLSETQIDAFVKHKDDNTRVPKADLAWHVRAWGQWVLDNARRELAKFYPTYADFEPLDKRNQKPYERQPMRLVQLKEDGTPDIDALNKDFSAEYLADKRNPRWVAKPTVAYLWARTVTCKNCRATIPLLKTRWLCKKDKKRVLLTMEPNADRNGVVFGIQENVPVRGGNTAQRREHDKRIGTGTMSRAGAKCPCCGTIITMEDIRLEGQSARLNSTISVVVVDGSNGKEYRLPTLQEEKLKEDISKRVTEVFEQVPFGIPNEALPSKEALGFRIPLYGFDRWCKLFSPRQLLSLGTFVRELHSLRPRLGLYLNANEYGEAILSYLACGFDRMLDFNSNQISWINSVEAIGHTFVRYALPITWDYSESSMINDVRGGWKMCLEAILESLETSRNAIPDGGARPQILQQSATKKTADSEFDIVLTDPPYYDAIAYSDLMDFFYVWLRRNMNGVHPEFDEKFRESLAPKWNHLTQEGELIDDSSRHDGDRNKSKAAYEHGMARAFQNCHSLLKPNGRLVVVFAHKQPDAWETLVTAIIRSGFVVDGSWPIQTEQVARMRAQAAAALASSVWLTCKKRPLSARPGWDTQVIQQMREKIQLRLREYWDANIKGPDFVWAATGPALEAYSEHPIVKKANEPDQILTVSEFLSHVRRMVVDFVVGRVLTRDGKDAAELAAADRLDEPTAYYLLHRHDFGLEEAPAGSCILYAVSCGLSDKELATTWDLITFTKGAEISNGEEEEADVDADEIEEESSGGKVKLKTWAQRKGKSIGYDAPGGKPIPLIDRVHRLMHLWKEGDMHKVDEYLDSNALRRQELFRRLLQSLIELSPRGSEERTLLESLSNHIQTKGVVREDMNLYLGFEQEQKER
jgi:adenine-specific DNA methylase